MLTLLRITTQLLTTSVPGFRNVNKDDIMKKLVGEKVDSSETIQNLINEVVMEDESGIPVT